jgi:hypothetical protein
MLYGVLLVQLCKPATRLFSYPIRLAHQMVKMYTTTISQAIGYSSSYLACHFFTDHTVLLSDSSSTVYTVFLLETLQTVLTGVDLYHWFASGFGRMDYLAHPNLSAFDGPIIGSVVSLIIQLFFAYRVWILSDKKSWWICMTICVVSRSHNSGPNPAT